MDEKYEPSNLLIKGYELNYQKKEDEEKSNHTWKKLLLKE